MVGERRRRTVLRARGWGAFDKTRRLSPSSPTQERERVGRPRRRRGASAVARRQGDQNMNMAPTWLVALLTACPEARWDAEPRLAAELRDLVGSFRLFAFE